MKKNEVLVVEEEISALNTILNAVKDAGYMARSTSSSVEALEVLKQNDKIGLVVTEHKAPGVDGEELFHDTKKFMDEIPFIFLSACNTINSVVKLMKEGAFYCIKKPIDEMNFTEIVKKALEENTLATPKDWLDAGDGYSGIVGRHKKILNVFEVIKTVSSSDVTVLIQGESGVGKELVAKAVHKASSRADKKMVIVNCAVLPENLLESELFGHMKGAFTGAIADKLGKFEVANRSTLFLDEIGEMPLHLQVKLLRFLQEREFERIGGHSVIKSDVRIIAATNLDLRKEVDEGRFRLDLYYRLHVIPIYIPNLKDRDGDIILLGNYFLRKYCRKQGRSMYLSKEAGRVLSEYSWPGNIRELENAIQQIVILCQTEEILASDIPLNIRNEEEMIEEIPLEGFSLPDKIAKLEKRWIESALRQNRWNRSKAANALGITRKVLFSKMKKNKISVPK